MDDPIAFFITITTYGTWLPGDARGWIKYQHGWQLPHHWQAEIYSPLVKVESLVRGPIEPAWMAEP